MTQDSWGWDLGRNKLYHKGISSAYAATQYPSTIAPSGSIIIQHLQLLQWLIPLMQLNNNGICLFN